MSLVLLLVLISFLGIVIYQDFKSREISWFLIPILCLGFIIKALLMMNVKELGSYFLINLTIVFINLFGVTIMVSFKERKLVNIVDKYLGLGDILFFVVLAIAFEPMNFVLFYLSSTLLTTIVYGGVWVFTKNRNMMIPLAGAMSLVLVIALFVEYLISSVQFYEALFLISGE